MTTPARVYQNVRYDELLAFAEHNPHRHRILEPIEIRVSLQETSLDSLFLPGYTSFNLNPAGILSVIACLTDPSYYSLAPLHARLQQVIELSTCLQEQTEQLKNTILTRKRKKIHDLIGMSYHGAKMEDKERMDLYYGISLMRNLQFVLLKEAVQESIQDGPLQDTGLKGEILFSSPTTTWTSEHPTWLVDFHGRWVAVPSECEAESLATLLPTWLTTIEQHGWMIQWPTIEGTKAELVEQCRVLPTWKEEDKKHTKDVLSARLGRALTLQRLSALLHHTA